MNLKNFEKKNYFSFILNVNKVKFELQNYFED